MRGLRWWELLPEGVVALGLGFFLLTETDAATSAFESSTALALMAATGVAWLLLRFALGRLPRRWAPARTGAFGLGALGVLLVVVVPAYDDTTVVETLTVDSTAPSTAPPTAEAEVDALNPEATTTVPAQPVVLATGALHGIDHRASGTVRLYEQPTGALVVGLEDIDIQPGPDYDVFVVPGADRDDIDGGTRLDDLRGNKGTQFYDVPADLGVRAGGWTVLVWCQTFDVPVAAATPA